MTTHIHFPHLGIYLDNVGKSISIFGFEIAYYGIIIGIGMLSGILMAVYEAKRTKQNPEHYYDLALYAIVMAILFVLSFFVGKPTGGVKAGILKLLIFVPILVFAFIMGAVLILEFAWWKLIAFMVVSVGIGYGVYYMFRLIDKKCGGNG